MTDSLKKFFDEREEIIFWLLLILSTCAVVFERATFLEASGFTATAYAMLLAKKAHDKRVINEL